MDRDGYRCQYCGAPAIHIDHLISKALRRRHRLPDNDPDFLVAACGPCNWHRSTFKLVPPNREHLIPLLPSTGWRTWNGNLPIPPEPPRR